MPIVLSKDEWARLGRWVDYNEDPEMVRRRDYVQFLDSTSKAMTKSWPNSLENVSKRNEELRRMRLETAEKANTNFYKRYVKTKQEEQERLMHSARDTVFKNKDAPKLLLSAVIETAVQKERSEQLKFAEEQRRAEAEQKRCEADIILSKAKEWNDLMEFKKKRRFEVNKEHQKAILEQAQEVAERNRIDYETELNLQKVDNMNAADEINAIDQFDSDFKAAEKQRIWADMERSRAEWKARKREEAARAHMDDRLIQVLLHSRARVDHKRKQAEKDIKDERIRVLDNISKKLETGDAEREAKEQAILDKAIKERLASVEARQQSDIRKKEQYKQERLAVRKQYLQNEAQRLHEFNTMRQWEIMNRFKNGEIYDEFKENQRIEKARKIKEYRADILKLWKEREDREARQRADTRFFYGELAERKLRHADNKLLSHAAALVAEAEAHARPPLALHRAVDRYCKMYRLYAMPELPASLQAHFKRYAPFDGSKPDQGYVELPAPLARGPKGSDLSEQLQKEQLPVVKEKRDGMHEMSKAGPSKSENAKLADDSDSDYKRAGRANGLQRRDAKEQNGNYSVKTNCPK